MRVCVSSVCRIDETLGGVEKASVAGAWQPTKARSEEQFTVQLEHGEAWASGLKQGPLGEVMQRCACAMRAVPCAVCVVSLAVQQGEWRPTTRVVASLAVLAGAVRSR